MFTGLLNSFLFFVWDFQYSDGFETHRYIGNGQLLIKSTGFFLL
jgi:hypothetical protein